MKQMILFAFMMTCGMMLASCDGDNDSPVEDNIIITTDVKTISVPADGGEYIINVTTTGKEWGAYTNDAFIKVATQNTIGKSGKVTVKVEANPETNARQGSVIIESGTARNMIPVSQEAAATSAYNAPEGYHLVWSDEFNEGSELNADNWTHEVKNSGWVNNELQNYVNHQTSSGSVVTEIQDGSLHIHCFKEGGKIYSGRVYAHVKQGWKYGYIEGRIKLPKGKGTWPAFWMMPVNYTGWPDSGEIDIMEEVGYHPNYVSSSLHANAHVHTNNTQVTKEMYCAGAEGDYHVYAIEWTHEKITTFVDGKVLLTYANRNLGHDDWPYDAPFYVILNLAWGGNWGGSQGVDESVLPVTMSVDYVRVFQK